MEAHFIGAQNSAQEKGKYLWTCPICGKNIYKDEDRKKHKCYQNTKYDETEISTFLEESLIELNSCKDKDELKVKSDKFKAEIKRYKAKNEDVFLKIYALAVKDRIKEVK